MAVVTPLLSAFHGGPGAGFYMRVNAINRFVGSTFLGLYSWQAQVLAMLNTALGPGGVRSVTFDSKFRIKLAASASFNIFNAASGTNALAYLGFSLALPLAAVNDPGTYGVSTPWGVTAALPILGLWNPELPPTSDSLPQDKRPNSTTGRSLNGYTIHVEEPTLTERLWRFGWLPMEKTYTEQATAAGDRSLQEFFQTASQFRYWPNALVPATFSDWVVAQDTKQEFAPDRQNTQLALFSHDLRGWKL